MTQAPAHVRLAQAPTPLVPVETVPRGHGSLLLSLGRLRSFVVDGLPTAQEEAVRGLGPTSSTHLRAVAHHRKTPPDTAQLLNQLALTAESAALPRVPDVSAAVIGAGALTAGIRGVIQGYVRFLNTDALPPAEAERTAYTPLDLVVLVTDQSLDLELSARWQSLGTSVLPVVTRGERVIIGPVLGQVGGPCGRCVELYRCAHDPARPAMLAALGSPRGPVEPEPAVTAIVSGVAGLFVRGLANGTPLPTGLGLTVAAPLPRIEHHVWRQHPGCGCADALG